nr:hypothetical protein [Tanacetum cinerariifolium]
MHNLVPNDNSIYNVSTKRAKHNLDSTYLWNCRLAHIRKMTRKSFPLHPERATDLLGIIHTDVCGPLRHVSRQGASYFITFTDDYNCYGYVYVYLLKHKHKVFDTFKVFKMEVENQLEKKIKAVQLDQGLCSGVCNIHFLNMVPTKKVDKTPYELWYEKVPNVPDLKAEFFKKSLITQEVSGRAIDHEEIQDEDTSPFENTNEISMEVEGFEPPREEVILVCWSERTHHPPICLCQNLKVEEW